MCKCGNMKIADICLTTTCNYKCDYCKLDKWHRVGIKNSESGYAFNINGPVLDYDKLLMFVNKYLDNYIIQLTGGEPTIIPGFEMLVKSLGHKNLIINTNGSRFLHINDFDNVIWRTSYHPTQCKESEFEKQVKSKKNVFINYVLHPKRLKSGEFFKDYEFLSSLGKPFEISGFEGEYEGKVYKFFDPIYDDFIELTEKQEKLEIMVIKPNGKIYKCYGLMEENKPIGDVYLNELWGVPCSTSCGINGSISLCPIHIPISKMIHTYSYLF